MSRRSNDWIFASLKRIKQLKWLNSTKLLLKHAKAGVHNIHRKAPVLESLFDKVAGLCP